MANVTQPVNVKMKYDQKDVIAIPMAAVKLFRGAMIFLSTAGYANKPTNTAGEKFLGIALETIDNSAGNAGDKEIHIVRKGLFSPPVTGSPTQASDLQAMYASDDQTTTLTANNNFVGRLETVESAGDTKGTVWIRMDSATLGNSSGSAEGAQMYTIPCQLADIAAQTVKVAIPYGFTLLSVGFRAFKAPTTAAKLSTATATVNGNAVTGGVISLTTAACTAGTLVAGSAISGANATSVGAGTVELTFSATTTFVEGDGQFEIVPAHILHAAAGNDGVSQPPARRKVRHIRQVHPALSAYNTNAGQLSITRHRSHPIATRPRKQQPRRRKRIQILSQSIRHIDECLAVADFKGHNGKRLSCIDRKKVNNIAR